MIPYYPALRFKEGEYLAVSKLPDSIKRYFSPIFIIPPFKERDPEKGAPLTPDEIAYVTGERIGRYWPKNTAFLDIRYIATQIGHEGTTRLIEVAQRRNRNLAVVATLEDLTQGKYRDFVRSSWPKIGAYVSYEDIDPIRLESGLRETGVAAEDCIIFVDFTGADLSPNIATDSVSAVLELLSEVSRWGQIVFLGSNYPTKNPAPSGGEIYIPRNEWITFHAALKMCSVPLTQIGYGDFAADCGNINFPQKGGGRPIPHLRYTLKNDTYVVRGSDTGSEAEAMFGVFNRVANSSHFSGRDFSYADDEIWCRTKRINNCGKASMWREWNTAHHVTRVISDLAEIAGLPFEIARRPIPAEQMSLPLTD